MEIDYSRLCHGCFAEKATPVCPYCGYDESAPAEYPLALKAGSVLNGKYMTGRVLGQGGFGITYLGFDLTLQVKVAIKEYMPAGQVGRTEDHSTVSVLSLKEAGGFEAGKEKFLDEARILARVQSSPNIVKVQNYFHENNTAYFVMEYIDGLSLKECIAQQGGCIAWQQAENLLLPIAEALGNVHAQNLLHRDISPDNIYVTQGGQSKLLDFGAARFALGDQKSLSVILKHGFAPEEQYRTRGNQGPWTDIYALGATFYYAVTGALLPDAIERLHSDTLAPPSKLGVRLPPHAEAALLRALAVKAEDRFHNMSEFIAALMGRSTVPAQPSAAAHAAMPALQRGYGQTAPAAAPQYAPGSAAAARPFWKKWGRQTWVILGSAAGAVLLLVVILTVALAGRGGGNNATGGVGGGGTSGVGGPNSLPPIGQSSASSQALPPEPSQTPDSSQPPHIPPPSGNFYSTAAVGGGVSLTLLDGWVVDEEYITSQVVMFIAPSGSALHISFEPEDSENLTGDLQAYMTAMAVAMGAEGATLISDIDITQLAEYPCQYFSFTIDSGGTPYVYVHNYLIDAPGGFFDIAYFQEFSNITTDEVKDVVEMLFTLTLYDLE